MKYDSKMPSRLYGYFATYSDLQGAPSIEKFALSIGATVECVQGFRRYRKFDTAYRECLKIRKDYLIDRALVRKFVPSLVKFLLEREGEERDTGIEVKVEVRE